MKPWKFSDIVDDDIQDGFYRAVISDVSETVSQSGAEMWVFSFKCEGSRYPLKHFQLCEPSGKYTQAAVNSAFASIARCFSIKEGSVNIDDFIGAKGIVKISHKPRGNPPVDMPSVSFPSPDRARNALIKAAQEKQAKLIAENPALLDSWDADNNEPLF